MFLKTLLINLLKNYFLKSVPIANSDDTNVIPNTKNEILDTTSSVPSADTSKKEAPNERRRINEEGLKLIKEFEGKELKAYKDAVGILTIGYGSTGPHVKEGLEITDQEAEELLLKDLERFEKGVSDKVIVEINDDQFSALVAFSYNVGLSALGNSTLLKKLNKKDYKGAAEEFTKWNKAGGKVLAGLTRRRKAEMDLFNKPLV